jgi:hypothetical protein
METSAIDFTPMGLDADWPARRWLEHINGRDSKPLRGVRLGHANDSAMVLTCTYPRDRFDDEVSATGSDPVREIAHETTYSQINLVLHQIRTPGARPDGLIGSLLRYAGQQASRYQEWPGAQWGDESAITTSLASWQSGFSLAYPDAYVIVHACGVSIDDVRLTPTAEDLSGYDLSIDPMEIGAMHWELWASQTELAYEDLAPALAML